ncbi:energy-coupling factor transporter transmembrane component T family protein [Corynebacterium sp. A21]|uniref:energy-coupling factor transporter transmembrane component T family protein n=1 Tax=Corynebacterium sp. A21 TaxID=3457318 RepID=UPI003FD60C27
MNTLPLGFYVPGNSLIHRTPPAWKFALLVLYILATAIFIGTPRWAALALLLPTLGYVIARIPLRVALGQLWPPLPILVVLGLFQWWQRDAATALTMVLVIFAAIMAATLLTLTTTIPAIMDALEQLLAPLARFGIPVEAISLAVSLTIRLIPLQLSTVKEVLNARKARGAAFSIRAFGTPVLIRSMRRAHGIAEALQARGVGD